nr:uncharacterized protein LOC105847294 [Hydra vulgaris]
MCMSHTYTYMTYICVCFLLSNCKFPNTCKVKKSKQYFSIIKRVDRVAAFLERYQCFPNALLIVGDIAYVLKSSVTVDSARMKTLIHFCIMEYTSWQLLTHCHPNTGGIRLQSANIKPFLQRFAYKR